MTVALGSGPGGVRSWTFRSTIALIDRVHGHEGEKHVHDEDDLKNHCSLLMIGNMTPLSRDVRIRKKREKKRIRGKVQSYKDSKK